MKKIPSFDKLKNILSIPIAQFINPVRNGGGGGGEFGGIFPLRTGISSRIYYSSVVSSLTDEFAEDTLLKTADVIDVENLIDGTDTIYTEINQLIDGNISPNEIYNHFVTVSFGLGGAVTNFIGNRHNIEILFISASSLLFLVSYIHHCHKYNNNDFGDKLDNFINKKQIKRNTKIFMLVLFMVLSRNVYGAS